MCNNESQVYCIYVNYVRADCPGSYNEAINSNESKKWKKTMNREIDCLMKTETWKLVNKPKDKKILDLK